MQLIQLNVLFVVRTFRFGIRICETITVISLDQTKASIIVSDYAPFHRFLLICCLPNVSSMFLFAILTSAYFANIPTGQWQLLMIVTSFTFIPATIFVLIELFRDSNADGTIQSKSKVENVIEGVCFLAITLMWIPTVMIATPPGGAASLIGNAYFFTWMLVVFVFEGVVWYIHDIRNEQHQELLKKEAEYRSHQRKILDETNVIIQNQRRQQTTNSSHDTDDLHSVITEF